MRTDDTTGQSKHKNAAQTKATVASKFFPAYEGKDKNKLEKINQAY